MIKKVKIIAHQVNMYCDKCGNQLSPTLSRDFPMQYLYKCGCGWKKTSKHMFPYTVVEYDLENAEIIEED